MNIISRIFFGKVDREMRRINRRSRIALHAIVYEENLIYRIERILDTDKDADKIKKEITGAKKIKRRFTYIIDQFIEHSRLIHKALYPHRGKIKNFIDGLEFEKGMIGLYWDEVFLHLDYEGMRRVIPIYLRLLRRIRKRIKIISMVERKSKQKVEVKELIPAKEAA